MQPRPLVRLHPLCHYVRTHHPLYYTHRTASRTHTKQNTANTEQLSVYIFSQCTRVYCTTQLNRPHARDTQP